MAYAIQVEQLRKSFGKKQALNDLSFEVKRGEIFGLLGPSGSGKTTIVKILTTQLLHTSGEVKVFEQDISKMRGVHYLQKIGILTDNSGLYERLPIEDNLLLFCKLYDIPAARVDEVLNEVNLLQDRKTLVKKLSKGMKQRVTLARAMLHKPELLFLDEPTSALDPVNMASIHEALRKLNAAGTTIFLTTHDMQEAETLCDRVAFLHHGKIAALDTPKKLRRQYSDQTITAVTADKEYSLDNNEEGGKLIYQLMQENKLQSIYSNEPTLGEIFVKITGRALA